jgi:putative ABC transport system ATP-binding protein
VATIVETVNLKKTYMLGKVPVYALRGVNLKVESGDFVAIVGPSGSGKSTLLNMIGALDKPTEGKVLIDGVDVSSLNDDRLAELRRRVGFVFQFFNLIPRLKANENVELPLTIVGVSKGERKRKTFELLKAVGLGERVDHNPTEMSGGEQQRVAIARALANDPRFLLLDEPTGNIDSKTADMLVGLLKGLNEKRGVTIIMITHDMNVARHAKRVIRLLDGKVDETGITAKGD